MVDKGIGEGGGAILESDVFEKIRSIFPNMTEGMVYHPQAVYFSETLGTDGGTLLSVANNETVFILHVRIEASFNGNGSASPSVDWVGLGATNKKLVSVRVGGATGVRDNDTHSITFNPPLKLVGGMSLVHKNNSGSVVAFSNVLGFRLPNRLIPEFK